MTTALLNTINFDYFQKFTDCVHFLNGICRFGRTCRYRHFSEIKKQCIICVHWPDRCRKIECRFRHPPLPIEQDTDILRLFSRNTVIGFFWNMEKIPIPSGQNAYDIIRRIRHKLVIERGLQEAQFYCYCDIETLSESNQLGLQHALVTIVHISGQQINEVNRQIMDHLDQFEQAYHPPAIVVLISDDIDFVDRLRNLSHHIIVIRNKLAKAELKAIVNEHYSWTLFTRESIVSSSYRLYSDNSQSTSSSTIQANSTDEHSSTRSVSPAHPISYPQIKTIPSDSNQSTPSLDYLNHNGSVQTNGHSYYLIRHEDDSSNSNEGIENNDTQECAFCDAQFDTIQALRQHQADRNHLYGCSVCDQHFFTHKDQIQHRISKEHYPNLDSNTSEDELSSNDRTKS